MDKTNMHETLIFRQVSLPVSTFDYLKDFQRSYRKKHGIHLSNNQCLTVILAEHKEASTREPQEVMGGEA